MQSMSLPSPDHNFLHPSVLPPFPAHFRQPPHPHVPPLPADIADQGILDTVALRVPIRLARPDERFLTGPGWTLSEGRTTGADHEDLGSYRVFRREIDGVRVLARRSSTTVEASLPRVVGLGNHEQNLMTWDQTLHAISLITEKLMPWTTALARVRSGDENELDWALHRVDPARNFMGSVAAVVAAYGSSRWPRCRRAASKITRSRNVKQLFWAGNHTQLSMYDKGHEMRSRKKHDRDSRCKPPEIDTVGRVELRFTGAEGMARLLALAAETGVQSKGYLPLWVKQGSGRPIRMMAPIDGRVLHEVLRAEIASLGAKRKPPESCRTLADFGVLKLAEDEGAMEQYEIVNAGKRALRETRAKVAAIRAEISPCNLVELCYERSS